MVVGALYESLVLVVLLYAGAKSTDSGFIQKFIFMSNSGQAPSAQERASYTLGQKLLNEEAALHLCESRRPSGLLQSLIPTDLRSFLIGFMGESANTDGLTEAEALLTFNAEDVLQRINQILSIPATLQPTTQPNPTLRELMQQPTPTYLSSSLRPQGAIAGARGRSARYSFLSSNDASLLITVNFSPNAALLLDESALELYVEYLSNKLREVKDIPDNRSASDPPDTSNTSARSPARGRSPTRSFGRTPNRPPRLVSPGLSSRERRLRVIKTHRDTYQTLDDARKTRSLQFEVTIDGSELKIGFKNVVHSMTAYNEEQLPLDPPTEQHLKALRETLQTSELTPMAHNEHLMHALGWKLAHQSNPNLPTSLQRTNAFLTAHLQVDMNVLERLTGPNESNPQRRPRQVADQASVQEESDAADPMQVTGTVSYGTVLWGVLLRQLQIAKPSDEMGWMLLMTYKKIDDAVPTVPLGSIYDNGAPEYMPCNTSFSDATLEQRPSLMHVARAPSEILTASYIGSNSKESLSNNAKKEGHTIQMTARWTLPVRVYSHAKDSHMTVSRTPSNNEHMPYTADYTSSTNGLNHLNIVVEVRYNLFIPESSGKPEVDVTRVSLLWPQMPTAIDVDDSITVRFDPRQASDTRTARTGTKRSHDNKQTDNPWISTPIVFDTQALRPFSEVGQRSNEFLNSRLFMHSQKRDALQRCFADVLKANSADASEELMYCDLLALQIACCGVKPNQRDLKKLTKQVKAMQSYVANISGEPTAAQLQQIVFDDNVSSRPLEETLHQSLSLESLERTECIVAS